MSFEILDISYRIRNNLFSFEFNFFNWNNLAFLYCFLDYSEESAQSKRESEKFFLEVHMSKENFKFSSYSLVFLQEFKCEIAFLLSRLTLTNYDKVSGCKNVSIKGFLLLTTWAFKQLVMTENYKAGSSSLFLFVMYCSSIVISSLRHQLMKRHWYCCVSTH